MKYIKLIILIIILGSAWFVWQLYSPASLEEEKRIFTIEQGQGVNEISDGLHESGFIKSKFVFESFIWLKRSEARIIAGRYELNTKMNIPQVLEQILGGAASQDHQLTFIEGWDRNEYSSYLISNGFSGEVFLDLTDNVSNWDDEFTFLADAPVGASLEGFLFPDTYNINDFTTEETLVRRMLINFDRRVETDLVEAAQARHDSFFDVVTLASIVENEVAVPEQRKTVAGIFYNRLAEGIGLQSDATINFVTGKQHRRPELTDLEIDSPYNTYKYRGLPPGPIGNPSLNSLESVVAAENTPYFYFLHNQAGEIFYAVTFDEHQENRELYLD